MLKTDKTKNDQICILSDCYAFLLSMQKKKLPLSFNFMSLNSKNWKNLI